MNIPGFQHFPRLECLPRYPVDDRWAGWDDHEPSAKFFWFALAGGVCLAAVALAWVALVWLLLSWLPSTL